MFFLSVRIVEHIALVSPETVTLNLAVATKGLEMLGLRNALMLNDELSALVQSSQREEFKRYLLEARQQGGMRAFLQQRDGPFQYDAIPEEGALEHRGWPWR